VRASRGALAREDHALQRDTSRPAGVRDTLSPMAGDRTIVIEGVTLHLAHPDELPIRWVGQ
jgi:hypothetical protein